MPARPAAETKWGCSVLPTLACSVLLSASRGCTLACSVLLSASRGCSLEASSRAGGKSARCGNEPAGRRAGGPAGGDVAAGEDVAAGKTSSRGR